MLLQNVRWPELKDLAGRIFVVPLGSLEQHGHHLPVFTDSLIISHVAERVESLRTEKIVMLPVQWLGHSPHHRRFGSVSLDLMPYVGMICGMCRSLVGMGARKIFLMNGHGGNDIPCKAALRELKSEFEAMGDLYIAYAAYWNLAAGAIYGDSNVTDGRHGTCVRDGDIDSVEPESGFSGHAQGGARRTGAAYGISRERHAAAGALLSDK